LIALLMAGLGLGAGSGCISEAELIGDPSGTTDASTTTSSSSQSSAPITHIVSPGSAGLRRFAITDGGRAAATTTPNFRISDVSIRGGTQGTRGTSANFNLTLTADAPDETRR
jgi:hypothetical protein